MRYLVEVSFKLISKEGFWPKEFLHFAIVFPFICFCVDYCVKIFQLKPFSESGIYVLFGGFSLPSKIFPGFLIEVGNYFLVWVFRLFGTILRLGVFSVLSLGLSCGQSFGLFSLLSFASSPPS